MSLASTLKQTLRARRTSRNPVVRYGIESIFAARRLLEACKTAWKDESYRSIVLLKLFSPQRLHQTTPLTWADRYPGIFAACRDYFGERTEINILSFGCSTGEEVLTLRRYFPSATITGAEINPVNLAACRKHEVDDRIAFIRSDPATIRRHGPFDAIFCMAVLQRTPHLIEAEGITDLSRIYPYEKYDRQVRTFDRWLRKDGLLVIHHSQYLFSEASVAGRYRPLASPGQEMDPMPKFDRNSRRVQSPVLPGSIFVKVAD